MKNILVTGGAGFIGSHFADYLLDRYPDIHVTIADILLGGKIAAARGSYLLEKYGERCNFKFVDIRERTALYRLFEDNHFDTVAHFAALGSNLLALENEDLTRKVNIAGTINVFEEATEHQVSTFYHQSTCEVYGNHIPGTQAFMPDAPLLGNSPYSRSKVEADEYIQRNSNTEMRVLIGRPCNVYGPCQHIEAATSTFIRKAIDKEPLVLTGDGKQVREWLFVSDLCQAIRIILEKGDHKEIYNIGSGEEKSIKDIALSVASRFDLGEDSLRFTGSRPKDDIGGYLLNSKKIRDMGWCSEMPFEMGLDRTIWWYKHWYPQHRDWWDERVSCLENLIPSAGEGREVFSPPHRENLK